MDSIQDIPTSLPVVMADGKVRNLAVELKADQASPVAHAEEGYSPLDVPYVITGTTLQREIRVKDAPEDYVSELEEKNRTTEQLIASGSFDSRVYIQPKAEIDVDSDSYSYARPSTDVKIVADSALKEYLGANIAAGKRYVDLSKFPESDDANSLNTEIEWIKKNNPLLPVVDSYYYSREKRLLEIQYGDYDENGQDRKAVLDKVLDISNTIITDDMTDLEKARNINTYLVDNADYDYEAYDRKKAYQAIADMQGSRSPEAVEAGRDIQNTYGYAWTADGVLLQGKGVCASYATAFYALATQADLECAYVVGSAPNGQKHAWNYVKIDQLLSRMDVQLAIYVVYMSVCRPSRNDQRILDVLLRFRPCTSSMKTSR